MAHDRVALAQGVDRPEIRRWKACRRHLARASGSHRTDRYRRAFETARRLDAELPAARTLRRAWEISAVRDRYRPHRSKTARHESACEWRRIASTAVAAPLPRLRLPRPRTRGGRSRTHPRARASSARRKQTQPCKSELSKLRARRDRIQSVAGGLRSI